MLVSFVLAMTMDGYLKRSWGQPMWFSHSAAMGKARRWLQFLFFSIPFCFSTFLSPKGRTALSRRGREYFSWGNFLLLGFCSLTILHIGVSRRRDRDIRLSMRTGMAQKANFCRTQGVEWLSQLKFFYTELWDFSLPLNV